MTKTKYIKSFKIFESKEYDFNFYAESWGNAEEAKEASEYLADKFKTYETNNPEIKNYAYVVYKLEGFIMAACEYSYNTDENEEYYIHINFIYTDIKKAGIASSMVESIINGYEEVKMFRCFVRESNMASLNMFQKLGFKIVGKIKFDDIDEISHVLELKK